MPEFFHLNKWCFPLLEDLSFSWSCHRYPLRTVFTAEPVWFEVYKWWLSSSWQDVGDLLILSFKYLLGTYYVPITRKAEFKNHGFCLQKVYNLGFSVSLGRGGRKTTEIHKYISIYCDELRRHMKILFWLDDERPPQEEVTFKLIHLEMLKVHLYLRTWSQTHY